jgi:hypothetical protein
MIKSLTRPLNFTIAEISAGVEMAGCAGLAAALCGVTDVVVGVVAIMIPSAKLNLLVIF